MKISKPSFSSSFSRGQVHSQNKQTSKTSQLLFVHANSKQQQQPSLKNTTRCQNSSTNPPNPESMQFTFPSWTFHLVDTSTSPEESNVSKTSSLFSPSSSSSSSDRNSSHGESSSSSSTSLITMGTAASTTSTISSSEKNFHNNGFKFKVQTISPFHSL